MRICKSNMDGFCNGESANDNSTSINPTILPILLKTNSEKMDRNTPKLPLNMKSSATLKNSPRKSSYTVGFPPNMPAFQDRSVRSVQEKSDVLAQHSLSTLNSNSVVVTSEFKNGTRSDVVALEAWTHKQLAEIHFKHCEDSASAHRAKERESADQVKVLDASAELLAKMVEVHCIDKARLMRKLWSSSAYLFNSIYTELSSIIHELKLKLSDKTMLCTRLEETMNRVRTAATPGGALSAVASHDRESSLPHGRHSHSHNHNTTHTEEPPLPFVDSQTATVRTLEEELLLKNQEMMQLQATLTSLAVWFPNFAKFNASILSKYLPPIDYLEELERVEREKEAEEKRLLQVKQEEEARFAIQMSQKHSPSGKHRPVLNAIGETQKEHSNHPKKADGRNEVEKEMQEVEIAQNYLLKDLKRLQGLGVGFAVLDPVELEAAKAAVSRNYLIAQSAGMFVHNTAGGSNGGNGNASTGGSGGANVGGARPNISTNNTNNATAGNANVPKSFASAVGRTSIALTNQFKHRLVTMKSFVEVQGDEYNLSSTGDSISDPVAAYNAVDNNNDVTMSTKEASPKHTIPTTTTPHTTPIITSKTKSLANNSLGAAAAAALQNVLQDETTTPLQIGGASPVVTAKKEANKTTNNNIKSAETAEKNTQDTKDSNNADTPRADTNMNDFYKLQNVRVSKIDADVAAATVQRLARSISAKSKGLLNPAAQPTIDFNVPSSLLQGGNNPDANEYELKYRNLLVDAQKLEVARAKAEKKMKDDAKAHHKQLLRMSAHVTTLQNKLQASHLSANLMLQKIPHVVFTPMIRREYSNSNSSYGGGHYGGGGGYEGSYNHNSHDYPHNSDYYNGFVKSNSTRVSEPTSTQQGQESAALNTLHSMFDSAFSDINVLLNNSRAPRRGSTQHASVDNNVDTNGDNNSDSKESGNRGGSTSPPRSRGRSAPIQQNISVPSPVRTLSIADIHHLIYRFCTHFVQSSPTAVSNNTADGTHANGGSGLRDELYVQFGQGPDQYKYNYLNAVLNGQSVTLYHTDAVCSGSGNSNSDYAVAKNAYKSAQYLEDSSISAGYIQPMEYGSIVDTHSRQPSVTFADEQLSVTNMNHSVLDSVAYDAQNSIVKATGVVQNTSVFATHLFQYLSSRRQKSTPPLPTPTTALLHSMHNTLLHQRDLLNAHHTHISRPSTGHNKSLTSNAAFQSTHIESTFPQEGLLKCLFELFGLTLSTPVYPTIPSTTTNLSAFSYLEYMNNYDPRQHKLRQSVFFDVFMIGFQAMQRYITNPSEEKERDATTTNSDSAAPSAQPHSFPLTATERILRRMFTIIGEDPNNSTMLKRRNTNNANHTNATVVSTITSTSVGNNNYASMRSNTSGVSHPATSVAPVVETSNNSVSGHSNTSNSQSKYEREAQSPPWWRTLTHSAFSTLKHDVRMLAVTEHRARALSEMLGATTESGRGRPEKDEEHPVELRVDCYECILTCMNTVYAQHHRLMVVLMNMYRFLESLSIQHSVANRTYHLLLAHFLQSAYPSVQDVSNAFNLSSVAQGTFSFAPRTAIVVNLELMCELQALQGRGVLNKHTFADAILRSVPNYLVQGLYHLWEPTSGAAHRAKLISDGTMHLNTLQEMLQRAYQHLHNEAIATATATAAEKAIIQSSKSHKRSSVVNDYTGNAVSPSGKCNNNIGVGSSGSPIKRSPRTDPDLKAQPSHFKQNYLLNKLLYPEETQVNRPDTQSPRGTDEPSEEEFLLQEMLDYESLFHTTDNNTNTHFHSLHKASQRDFTVTVNPFIQKLLLHCKLSYEAEVTGVLATSIAEVTFTTWAMQYVVETLSRLRGSSMRLKTLFKKDMKQYTYTTTNSSNTTDSITTTTTGSNPVSSMSPSLSSAKHTAPLARKVSTGNANANIGSIGDYVLVDILLGDVDLDLFVRVEAHYIRALQKKVFRAWSMAVEDIFED